jgi:hypothetical protein
MEQLIYDISSDDVYIISKKIIKGINFCKKDESDKKNLITNIFLKKSKDVNLIKLDKIIYKLDFKSKLIFDCLIKDIVDKMKIEISSTNIHYNEILNKEMDINKLIDFTLSSVKIEKSYYHTIEDINFGGHFVDFVNFFSKDEKNVQNVKSANTIPPTQAINNFVVGVNQKYNEEKGYIEYKDAFEKHMVLEKDLEVLLENEKELVKKVIAVNNNKHIFQDYKAYDAFINAVVPEQGKIKKENFKINKK